MFSGIVEESGTLKRISQKGNVTVFEIEAELASEDTKIGDSLCVNGVCLTLTKKENKKLVFQLLRQTLDLTTLGDLKIGDRVNLERSLKLGDRISGHLVTGHVDCVGIVRTKGYRNNNLFLEISVPVKYMKYIAPKGSVALDGISLTVAEKKSNSFTVYLIPHTLENTTIKSKGTSSKLNVEFDILSKYSQP